MDCGGPSEDLPRRLSRAGHFRRHEPLEEAAPTRRDQDRPSAIHPGSNMDWSATAWAIVPGKSAKRVVGELVMAEQAQEEGCRFMRELVALLAEEQPGFPLSEQEHLFQQLLDLEKRAEAEGADAVVRAAIASARRMSGVVAAALWPPRVRGH